MKITSFYPSIVTKNAEATIALFEALGFERRHTKTGINGFVRSFMVWLSESVGHEEFDRFIEIIHIYADHRVLAVAVRDVYMKAVFVLHPYVRGIDFADILFDVVPLKAEILKNLDSCFGIPCDDERIECCDFHYLFLSFS